MNEAGHLFAAAPRRSALPNKNSNNSSTHKSDNSNHNHNRNQNHNSNNNHSYNNDCNTEKRGCLKESLWQG